MIASLLGLSLLQTDLNAVLNDPVLDGGLVSAYVCKLDGTRIFERNSGTRVVPASNQKLISTTFAMSTLGPDQRMETKFWREPEGIVIFSPGDPSLTRLDVQAAGQKLGVKPTDTLFLRQAYQQGVPDGWEFDDLPNKYAPRITAFSVDKAAFTLESEKGAPMPLPFAYGVQVTHHPADVGDKVTYDPFTGEILVRGPLSDVRAKLDTLSQPDPARVAGACLGSWRLAPIQSLPPRSPDYSLTGKALGEVMKECLVDSDNYHAEHFLLLAASSQGELPAKPYPEARKRATTFIASTGAKVEDFNIQDGSGMSRHNLVTTRGLAQLLCWVNKQPWATQYESYLVKANEGTLKGRMADALSFRGKTGTLDMVVALSGYVKNAVGETLVASVILNHSTSPSSKQRAVVDRFMATLEKSR